MVQFWGWTKGENGLCTSIPVLKCTVIWVMSLLVPRFTKVKSGYDSGRDYNGKPCCNSNINDSLGDILPSGCSWNNLNPECHSTSTKSTTQEYRRKVMPRLNSRNLRVGCYVCFLVMLKTEHTILKIQRLSICSMPSCHKSIWNSYFCFPFTVLRPLLVIMSNVKKCFLLPC